MSGRSFGSISPGGLISALLPLLLLLPWSSGCKGPEYAPHQPITGVDRPYPPQSTSSGSEILEQKEAASREKEERREEGKKKTDLHP